MMQLVSSQSVPLGRIIRYAVMSNQAVPLALAISVLDPHESRAEPGLYYLRSDSVESRNSRHKIG